MPAMIGTPGTVERRLLTRRCVRCGHNGPTLNRRETRNCPECGCDFAERPPRSYAEMEGLLGTPTLTQPRRVVEIEVQDDDRNERVVYRWLAFIFICMIGLLAIAYFAAAVMAV